MLLSIQHHLQCGDLLSFPFVHYEWFMSGSTAIAIFTTLQA